VRAAIISASLAVEPINIVSVDQSSHMSGRSCRRWCCASAER
jgi:hypothetical protein